jgi:uncharacterized protein (DUF2267 family)
MSSNGLEVFDKTLETTHIWLKEIMEDIGPDRHVAWHVLSVVLQRIRDRLPLPLAAHLGAQLPMLIRGVYYDQFDPSHLPGDRMTREQFVEDVAQGLRDTRPVDPVMAIGAVFGVLSRHVSEAQIRKVCDALPRSIRNMWQEGERLLIAETIAAADF